MCAPAAHRDRTVEEDPPSIEATREQGGVLVLGRHGGSEALERPEVLRDCQRDQRPASAVRGVRHRVLGALWQPGRSSGPRSPRPPRDAGPGRAPSPRPGRSRQPETPSPLRATARCEMPRRSSTRASSTVSPSQTTAPGLKMVFAAYGRDAAVRMRVVAVAGEQLMVGHAQAASRSRWLGARARGPCTRIDRAPPIRRRGAPLHRTRVLAAPGDDAMEAPLRGSVVRSKRCEAALAAGSWQRRSLRFSRCRFRGGWLQTPAALGIWSGPQEACEVLRFCHVRAMCRRGDGNGTDRLDGAR